MPTRISVILLLLAVPVSAVNNFVGSAAVALWNFEESGTSNYVDGIDSIGNNDLTEGGCNTYIATSEAVYQQGLAAGDFELSESFDYLMKSDTFLDAGFPFKDGSGVTTISLCLWFRCETLASGGHYTLFDKSQTANDESSFHTGVGYNATSGTYVLFRNFYQPDGDLFETYRHYHSGMTTGVWYHVGFVYSATTGAWKVRLYDESAGTATESSGTGTNAGIVGQAPLRVGASNGTNDRFDGLIDEAVIFPTVLTSAEIDCIRNGTYPTCPTGGQTGPLSELIGITESE